MYVPCLIGCALLAACGASEGSTGGAAASGTGGSGGAAGSGQTESAQYLAVGRFSTPEGQFGYGNILNSIGPDTVIDLEQAGVFPGIGSLGVADEPNGEFFVGVAESPLIQRYQATADNSVELTGEFSVFPFGAPSGVGIMLILDRNKGYLFSYLTQSIIVFDPEAMELVREVPVDFNLPPGIPGFFGNVALRDGNRVVIMTMGSLGGVIHPATRAVIVDIETDEVRYADREGCGGLVYATKDTSGNLYFGPLLRLATEVLVGVADPANQSCILRIARGADDFDPDFVDLLELAGRPVGGLVSGPGDSAYLLALADGAPAVDLDNFSELNITENWSYKRIDLTNPSELLPVPEFENVSGGLVSYEVLEAGRTEPTPFLVRVSANGSESTVFDVSDPSAPAERYTAPGRAITVFRLR